MIDEDEQEKYDFPALLSVLYLMSTSSQNIKLEQIFILNNLNN